MPDRPLAQIEQENADLRRERDEFKDIAARVVIATCKCGAETPHWSILSNFPTCHSCVWKMEQRLAVIEAREEAANQLEAKWREQAEAIREVGTDSSALERRCAAKQIKRCADELAALLAPSSPADTET